MGRKAHKPRESVKLFVVELKHSTDFLISTQVRQIEDFIQMKLDAIGLFAIERKGILPVMEKVNRAGIPIITLGTDSWGKRECLIATDEVLGGKLGAENSVSHEGFIRKKEGCNLEGSLGHNRMYCRVEG